MVLPLKRSTKVVARCGVGVCVYGDANEAVPSLILILLSVQVDASNFIIVFFVTDVCVCVCVCIVVVVVAVTVVLTTTMIDTDPLLSQVD